MRPRVHRPIWGWPRRMKKYKEFMYISRREYFSRRDGILHKGPCLEDNVRVSREFLEKHPMPLDNSMKYLYNIQRDVEVIRRILEK